MLTNEEASRENVTVGDFCSNNGFFIYENDECLVIASRPDWVRSPLSRQKLYIKDMHALKEPRKCPMCQFESRHGIITLQSNPDNIGFVLVCRSCKQFVWLRAIKESTS
jgi:hypothetical protein